AEDGIRDRNVTGVQTCALPILLRALWTSFIISFLISLGTLLSNCLKVKEVVFITKKNKLFICFVHNFDYSLVSYSDLKRIILGRSEERRVGKESNDRSVMTHRE